MIGWHNPMRADNLVVNFHERCKRRCNVGADALVDNSELEGRLGMHNQNYLPRYIDCSCRSRHMDCRTVHPQNIGLLQNSFPFFFFFQLDRRLTK